ncbi:Alpha-crystallin domain-containing protein 22.3 [Bienertia sinuspersici]
MASPPIRPPHQPALSVTPLNSMPYIDPITSHGNDDSFQPQGDVEPVEPAKPALIYLPSQPTEEERNQILSVTHNGVDTYLFRVGLPGVARAPDGRILIKGVTTTGGEDRLQNSMKFLMQSQNLCPPGHFSISFQLPGPVDSQDLTGHFGIDGISRGS